MLAGGEKGRRPLAFGSKKYKRSVMCLVGVAPNQYFFQNTQDESWLHHENWEKGRALDVEVFF